MKLSFLLLTFLASWSLSKQSIDLNLRQLQFVSDHLTTNQCRKLLAALHEKKVQVNGRKLKPVKDDEPCLLHLVDWNKREGRDATVEDLTLPLHQIGRADIAKVLSKVVHDETTHELHKFFLDDPFKKTARHHGSRLLTEDEEDDDKEESRRPANVHHVKRRPLMLAVFGFTVTLLTTITLICLAYCRTACATVCPKGCVIAFEAIKESCQETLALCKRLANKYVMGREEEARPLNMDKQDYKQREHIVKNIMQPAVAV